MRRACVESSHTGTAARNQNCIVSEIYDHSPLVLNVESFRQTSGGGFWTVPEWLRLESRPNAP